MKTKITLIAFILSLNIFDSKKIILLKDPIFNISEINKQKIEFIEEKLILLCARSKTMKF